MFGLSGAALSPYLYMNTALSGRSGLSGMTGLYGLSGQNSLYGLSGLSGRTGLEFSSILQKALDSLSNCDCERCSAGTVNSEAKTARKSATLADVYKDYMQQSTEQYRSSLKQSLIKSGKISSRSYLNRYGQAKLI